MKQKKIEEVTELQFDLLNLFHKTFSRTFHEIGDGPHNLNKNQKRAIMVIGMKGEIIPTVLGKYLDLQKGSLTSLIDSLEKEGMIQRRRDPEDRRKILISLTENGKKYRKWLTGEIQSIVSGILDKLDEEEITSYRESLENVIDVFKKLDRRT